MSRRRVLILCYFYPPLAGGGVHRVLSFTRHLPASGWDCTVVCAGGEDYWVTDESLVARVPPATEVIRVNGGSALAALLRWRRGDRGRRRGGTYAALRRMSDWWLLPDSYLGWARRAGAAAARRIAAGGVDALLSSSPPDSVHLAALGLARRFPIPWVADFRDPWIGLHLRTPPTPWHRARQAALERSVMERADLVLAASATDAVRAADPARRAPRRIEHLANGFEPQAPAAGAPRAASEPAPAASSVQVAGPGDAGRGRFTWVFTGTLSLMADTGFVLEGLHDLFARLPEARRDTRLRLLGPYDRDDEDRADALGLRGIVAFEGARSHAETLAAQRAADGLLLWKPRGAPTMVPGKLYEYLDSGRPILAVLPPGDEAAALVERAGGARVAPGDRAALGAALEAAWRAWRAAGPAAAARPQWVDDYARPRLAQRLAGLLDGLAAASGGGAA